MVCLSFIIGSITCLRHVMHYDGMLDSTTFQMTTDGPTLKLSKPCRDKWELGQVTTLELPFSNAVVSTRNVFTMAQWIICMLDHAAFNITDDEFIHVFRLLPLNFLECAAGVKSMKGSSERKINPVDFPVRMQNVRILPGLGLWSLLWQGKWNCLGL